MLTEQKAYMRHAVTTLVLPEPLDEEEGLVGDEGAES